MRGEITMMTDPTAGLDVPVGGDRRLLVSHPDYLSAQRTVDTLSDAGFPVQNVSIVGQDLRLEEAVTGRVTNARAALTGAGSGAVFGVIVGLFLGLFTSTTGSFVALVLWAALWGAVLGAAFGFINHAFQGGKRDFASRSAIVAGRYDVLVTSAELERARQLLDGVAAATGSAQADTAVVTPPPSAGTYDPARARAQAPSAYADTPTTPSSPAPPPRRP
ncbi:general stress protein [Thermocatellispora tengchongensis]|uniref:general stress protein n=1 Tax=Thermocatellispora tengchongensis TaxID=1073253 RepID=UPI00363A5EB3